MKKLRVAVIGVGHLGRHHARVLDDLPNVELVGVSDKCADRCSEVAKECGVPAFEDYRPLLSRVDAATIAVPTTHHFDVAKDFLAAGKSVLVEKPLSNDVGHAKQLVQLARRNDAILQVGHIEQFNPVLQAIPPMTGRPRFIQTHRMGPYSFRSTDIGVVFDLMIHDVDIVLSLLGELPTSVRATAWSIFGAHEDISMAELTFPGGTVAQLTASRAHAKSQREMSIWWTNGFTRLDFAKKKTLTVSPTPEFHRERARFICPSPHEVSALRTGMAGRFCEITEKDWSNTSDQLTLELEHFISSIVTRSTPRVSGEQGQSAVKIAAMILNAAYEKRQLPTAA